MGRAARRARGTRNLVRIALIGCGKVTERLALPQLRRCPDAEVVALVDRNRTAAERLAAMFRIDRARIWTNWRRMLREAEVDAVGVCVPNYLHAEVTLAALEAKKHVLVEKPMATTLADADAMVDAARAHHRYLMVEQAMRFDAVHEVAYELLHRRRLGRISMVHGRIGHAGPEYWSRTSTWFTDKRQAGGGALMDVGIHLIDLVRWLLNVPVKRVCAVAKTLEKRVAVEDNASCLLEFVDGTLGTCEASWTTRPYEVTTRFYGERGTLRTAIGATHPVVVRFSRVKTDPNLPREQDARPAIPATSRYGGAYPYFITCITTATQPSVSGEEGRASLEVVLAAYESIRRGGWIDLPVSSRRSRGGQDIARNALQPRPSPSRA